ncbi:MAG: mechanosensitive ion channel family protein [Persicimonas sp.]
MTEGLDLAVRLAVFLLICLAAWILARILGRIVQEAVERSKVEPSPLLKNFLVNVTRKLVIILGIIVGLDTLGVDTAAIIAGLGASGLIIGFALKDTLSNFAAGFLLLFYRPFEVDHYVELGSIEGTVRDMTLVSTVLATGDNKIITIPNSQVWGEPITNYTQAKTRRIELVTGVSYDDDIKHAQQVLEEVLTSHEKVLDDPAPTVTLRELADSAVTFDVRAWVDNADYSEVKSDLLAQIKLRLDEEGISMPYPQRDVWLHEVDSGSAA